MMAGSCVHCAVGLRLCALPGAKKMRKVQSVSAWKKTRVFLEKKQMSLLLCVI